MSLVVLFLVRFVTRWARSVTRGFCTQLVPTAAIVEVGFELMGKFSDDETGDKPVDGPERTAFAGSIGDDPTEWFQRDQRWPDRVVREWGAICVA